MQETNHELTMLEQRFKDLKSLKDAKLENILETDKKINNILQKEEKSLSDFFWYQIFNSAIVTYANEVSSLEEELDLILKQKQKLTNN